MELEFKNDCTGVDWQMVSDTLRLVGMAYHRPENHKKAFESSNAVVFVYREGDHDRLRPGRLRRRLPIRRLRCRHRFLHIRSRA